jgi:hypothetical protein
MSQNERLIGIDRKSNNKTDQIIDIPVVESARESCDVGDYNSRGAEYPARSNKTSIPSIIQRNEKDTQIETEAEGNRPRKKSHHP